MKPRFRRSADIVQLCLSGCRSVFVPSVAVDVREQTHLVCKFAQTYMSKTEAKMTTTPQFEEGE